MRKEKLACTEEVKICPVTHVGGMVDTDKANYIGNRVISNFPQGQGHTAADEVFINNLLLS